jgi:antiviral helicase SKI2
MIQKREITQILDPSDQNGTGVLESLGLGGLPSREQVHREIEEKLLLPQENLPDHLLAAYQMYEDAIWMPDVSKFLQQTLGT